MKRELTTETNSFHLYISGFGEIVGVPILLMEEYVQYKHGFKYYLKIYDDYSSTYKLWGPFEDFTVALATLEPILTIVQDGKYLAIDNKGKKKTPFISGNYVYIDGFYRGVARAKVMIPLNGGGCYYYWTLLGAKRGKLVDMELKEMPSFYNKPIITLHIETMSGEIYDWNFIDIERGRYDNFYRLRHGSQKPDDIEDWRYKLKMFGGPADAYEGDSDATWNTD